MLKNSIPQIPCKDPFANDALERFEYAEKLTTFVESIKEPYVLSVDAGFGQGKTTFIRMWAQYLRMREFPVLVYNAWEHDFTHDPLDSILSELQVVIEKRAPQKGKSAEKVAGLLIKVREKVEKLAPKAAGYLAQAGITTLVANHPGLSPASGAMLEAGKKIAENVTSDIIQLRSQHLEAKTAYHEIHESLAELLSGITEGAGHPVVFFIDELDRCRPTYAIELLERIKHVFGLQGIVYILSVNFEQLERSVAAIYGENKGGEGYLQRFIDRSFILPEPQADLFPKYLYGLFNLEPEFKKRETPQLVREGDRLLTVFTEAARKFELTLRQQEQCFSVLSLIIRITPTRGPLFIEALTFLVILKSYNTAMFHKFTAGRTAASELIKTVRNLGDQNIFIGADRNSRLVSLLHMGSMTEEQLREENYRLRNLQGRSEEQKSNLRVGEELIDVTLKSATAVSYLREQIEYTEHFRT